MTDGYTLSSQLDGWIVLSITILFTFLNKIFFKKNPLYGFLSFYLYVIIYFIPFLYASFFSEKVQLIIPKYQYLEFGFFSSFLAVFIFLFCSNFIIHKISLNTEIFKKQNLKIDQYVFLFFNLLLISNVVFTYFEVFFYPFFYLIFNPQTILIFVIYFYLISEEKNKIFIFFLSYILIYIINSIYFGSRSGIFNVLIYYFILSCLIYKDYFLKFKSILNYFALFLFALISFPVATIFRVMKDTGYYNSFSFNIIFSEYSIGSNYFEFLILQIVNRLKMIDYSYVIYNDLYNNLFFDQNLNFINFIKSFINITFPLNLFDEVLTSNTYLRSLNEDLSKSNLINDWSSYNSTFLDFNVLYFGIFGAIIISLMILYFYDFLIRIFNHRNTLFSNMIFVFLIIQLMSFFIFFGYDYFLKTLIHGFITILVVSLTIQTKFRIKS